MCICTTLLPNTISVLQTSCMSVFTYSAGEWTDFHIIFSVHSDIKSQIKKPTNALYFQMYSLMLLHMFRLYQAIIRGSKVYIY
jgi:hypothetical protein